MLLCDLGQDVLDTILRRLPDFHTLTAAILSSRRLYDTFNAHPKSIRREIAGNLCGHPAVLPAALRVVRTVLKEKDGGDTEDDEDNGSADVMLPQPAPEEDMFDIAILRAESELLARYGDVVRSLEDVYSWRYRSLYSCIVDVNGLTDVRFGLDIRTAHRPRRN